MHNKDMQCPYCGEWIEVCPDNDIDEDTLHEQDCDYCDKTFVYRLSIVYNYYPETADCLNDGNHKWKKQVYDPRYPDRKLCTGCGRVEWGKFREWEL